jgi:hypothetical protein
LLLDRETRACAVGTARAVQRALHTGNPAPAAPPWLQPAPGEPLLSLTEAAWQAVIAGFREVQVPITPEEIHQQLAAYARLLDALTAWLDAQAG